MNTTLHVTLDKQTKEDAARLANKMGLDLSTVVKAGLKAFVQTQVFHVEHGPRMTPYLEDIIARARIDFKARKNISPSFKNSKEAMRWLKKNSK